MSPVDVRRLVFVDESGTPTALAIALAAISPEDAHGWFRHAGYTSLAQAP